MDAFDAELTLTEIEASPEAEHTPGVLEHAEESSPAEGAAALERLASSVAEAQPARAARLLTEAAALWAVDAGDPKRASRALRAAIELAPGDEEALARLVELYRDNDKHASLARILERRAETIAEQAGRDPVALRRAADAFTMLGHLLRDPPLDSPVEAIAAYHRGIATGVAPAETYRAARAIYLREQQVSDALPLFAMERARTTDPELALALYREEAAARKLAGDGPGATDALRRARAFAPEAPGLAEEVGRSILGRVEAAEQVPPAELTEAGGIFIALAELSDRDDAWRPAERCYEAARRWEDASWAAERRGDYPRALELLARNDDPAPEARIRLGLREARLCAVGLGNARRAAACYTALLGELTPECDAAMLEGILRADRGGTGSVADVAARLEAAALDPPHVRGLKLAFELAAHALAPAPRAAELVRQAEVLAGLGAERHLALRHAEAGLAGLSPADAGPLLDRLSTLAPPDEAIDLYERHIGRCEAPADRAAAIELAARVALRRASIPRLGRFFEVVAGHCADELSLAALEKAAVEGDRKRGGTVLRGLFATALSKADPGVLDGGKTRSDFLRRAARMARRDLGDPDLAFEWLGDALFARLEGALEDALSPLADHTDELRRTETAFRELRALLERDPRARPADAPAPSSRAPTMPPPPPRAGSKPAPPLHPPTRPPPAPRVPHFDGRPASMPPASLELRDPFPATPPPPPAPPPPSPPAAGTAEVPFLPGPRRRLSGEELIADLFESMQPIDFCKDAIEAAAYTLTLAMDKLASPVGVVHLYDIDRREFVVVFARGPGAAAVRGLRTADAEPLAAEVMRTRGALLLREGAADARAAGKRWEALGAAGDKAIVAIACARVTVGGRFLGMVELCNLEGGPSFAEGDDHALAYIAERFAEFVAAHGIVLGEDR